ncbi:MAG: hypothetical protein IT368_11960, partial [Candidatus Hydrogenedentes bacterium]|nr:hypothetical protein [Candidatus Hydrogenedentota bacterium]
MAAYNPDFWEIATDSTTLDRVPAQSGLWFETEIDRERRYAMREFYEAVKPAVHEIITSELTERQREIIQLYYVYGKTQ